MRIGLEMTVFVCDKCCKEDVVNGLYKEATEEIKKKGWTEQKTQMKDHILVSELCPSCTPEKDAPSPKGSSISKAVTIVCCSNCDDVKLCWEQHEGPDKDCPKWKSERLNLQDEVVGDVSKGG